MYLRWPAQSEKERLRMAVWTTMLKSPLSYGR